jgi:shikimate kinase
MNLWLVGMMGSGKTEAGRRVAKRLDMPFVDLDREVERRVGRSVAEIWEQEGEAGFRRLEAEELRRLTAAEGQVIATGGGAVLDPDNVARIRGSGRVFWLDAPAEVLAARMAEGGSRPLLAGSEPAGRLSAILTERRRLYRLAAHHRVAADRDPDEVAARIEALWNGS